MSEMTVTDAMYGTSGLYASAGEYAKSGLSAMAEPYNFSLDGNLVPCVRKEHECPFDVVKSMFAKSDTIQARMTEESSMSDLVGLVEKYCIDPKFRMMVFWAEMVEWFYSHDLMDLSNEADMRYKIVKSSWSCMDILPGLPVVHLMH